MHPAHVELSATESACSMQRYCLHADKIIPAWEGLRKCKGDAGYILCGEANAAAAVSDGRNFIYFKPDGAIAGPSCCIGVRGYLRHVDVHNTWMIDRAGAANHEANLLTGCDRQGGSRRVRRGVVAAQIRRCNIGNLCLRVR